MSEPATITVEQLPDGTPIKFGYRQPGELRFGAVAAWAEANEVLPESQWEEHDDYAKYYETSHAQPYSNCTNASFAPMLQACFRSQGIDCPDLSTTYLWAHHNGGNPDNGAMCRDIAFESMSAGLPSLAKFPESQYRLPRGGVSQDVIADAKQHVSLEVYQCLTFEDVASALTRRFFVYHGFVLGSRFFNTGKDGIVPAWDRSLANGHAMASRGLRKINGIWRTVTPNTWGPSFGADGVGFIDRSYFWDQMPYRGSSFVNLDAYAVRAVKANATVAELPAGKD